MPNGGSDSSGSEALYFAGVALVLSGTAVAFGRLLFEFLARRAA
jgi:hypothetical protein